MIKILYENGIIEGIQKCSIKKSVFPRVNRCILYMPNRTMPNRTIGIGTKMYVYTKDYFDKEMILFQGYMDRIFEDRNQMILEMIDEYGFLDKEKIFITLNRGIYPRTFLKSYLRKKGYLFYPTPVFLGKYIEYRTILNHSTITELIQYLSEESNYYAYFYKERFLFIPKYYDWIKEQDKKQLSGIIHMKMDGDSIQVRKNLETYFHIGERIKISIKEYTVEEIEYQISGQKKLEKLLLRKIE